MHLWVYLAVAGGLAGVGLMVAVELWLRRRMTGEAMGEEKTAEQLIQEAELRQAIAEAERAEAQARKARYEARASAGEGRTTADQSSGVPATLAAFQAMVEKAGEVARAVEGQCAPEAGRGS